MANLNEEFKKFHNRIELDSTKKESLRKSRNAIRDLIRKFFQETLKFRSPKFYMQGSFAMGTTVNPLDGEFDVDDGVYLQHLDESDKTNWPAPETVHRWLVIATDGQTKEKPIEKRACVRVRYAGQYHVDLPSYANLNGDHLLAEKGDKGWHRSDPKALSDWFMIQLKNQGEQLRRIIRYLKAWADFQSGRRGKMPSGLILTVLASENFSPDERDDVAFCKTVAAISNFVSTVFVVYNPVDSSEKLTARLTLAQKERFQGAISELAYDAVKAIETDSSENSSNLWRKQFGDRFPKIETDKNTNHQKEFATTLGTFYASKNPAKPWGHL